MNAAFVSNSGGLYEINALILNITNVFTNKLIKNDVKTNQIDWPLSVRNYFIRNKMILVTNLYPADGETSQTCVLANGDTFYPLKVVINRVRLGVEKLLADRLTIQTKKALTDAIPKWFTGEYEPAIDHTPAKSLINDNLFRTTGIKNVITTKFHVIPSDTVDGEDRIIPFISYKDDDGDIVEEFSEAVTEEFVASAITELNNPKPVEVRVIPEKARRGRPVVDVVIDFGLEEL
jgi:hypothetical protein